MRRSLLLTVCLFVGACAQGGPFLLQPAAALPAGPTAAAEGPRFFLQPFQDRRMQRALLQSRDRYFAVTVKAAGLSRSAKAWQAHEYQDLALLWQRSLGQALAASGLQVQEADAPDSAVPADARYAIQGRLERLDFKKTGHDSFLGTNYSGTDYTLNVKARVRVDAQGATAPALDRSWSFSRVYYEPTRLGAVDQDVVPGFFVAGLKDASEDLAGQDDLRILAGLAPFTPTPTPTPTPQMKAPTPGPVVVVATPTPAPDNGPHWYNPKTGHRVDPTWNFDPEDGTPRRDFVLRSDAATPAPSPAPTPRPTSQTSPAPSGGVAP